MHKTFKYTTIWNLFHLYANTLIGIIKGILIVPFYLHYIDSSLYGAWLATGNVLAWLTLFDPGIGDVSLQKVASTYGRRDYDVLKYQITSTIVLSFIISLMALSVGILSTNYVFSFLELPSTLNKSQLTAAFTLGVIGTAITLFSYSLSGIIIGLQATKELGFIRNGVGVLSILLNLYLLFNGYQLLSIAYSIVISAATMTLAYSILLYILIKKENIKLSFSYKYLVSYSRIFGFTFGSSIVTSIAQNIDLLLIAKFVNVEQVTIFELSRRPLKILRNIVTSPSIAALPSMAHLYGQGNTEQIRKIITVALKLSIIILMFICCGIIVFNEYLIGLWVGAKFYIGPYLNVILAITFLFSTLSYINYNFTYSLGKIKENSVFEIIKNSISLIILVLMGWRWGLLGVVLAGLIVTLISETWYYLLSLKKILGITNKYIRSNLKEIVQFGIFLFVLTIGFSRFHVKNWPVFVFYFVMYSIVGIAGMYMISKEVRLYINRIFSR